MIKRSLVPLLPEGGRTYYNRIGDRTYRLTVRPCAQTCMPGHCENMMVTHPEWSIYKMTQALMGREKGQQIRELKPIVCLHGFSESSFTWNDIYLPGYLVIGIDILGHGGSSSPEGPILLKVFLKTSIVLLLAVFRGRMPLWAILRGPV